MRRPTVKVSLESERATALLNDTHRWEQELSIDCLPPAIPTSNCPIAAGHDRRPLAESDSSRQRLEAALRTRGSPCMTGLRRPT